MNNNEDIFKIIETKTALELVKLGRKYYIENNIDIALLIFKCGVDKFPNNEKIFFEYGNLQYELNNINEAKKYIEQAIKINPNNSPKKYLLYAELTNYPNNIQFYNTAINILEHKINILSKKINSVNDIKIKNKIIKRLKNYTNNLAQSYCSLGEIYFYNNDVNNNPLDYLLKAIQCDKYYLESYYHIIFYYVNNKNYNMFLQFVKELIKNIKEMKKEKNLDLKNYDSSFFLPLIRVFQESLLYEDSAYLCKISLENNDESPDIIYLYAFSNYNLGNYDICFDCNDKLKELEYGKDKEIEEAMTELMDELNKKYNPENIMVEENSEDWVDDNN